MESSLQEVYRFKSLIIRLSIMSLTVPVAVSLIFLSRRETLGFLLGFCVSMILFILRVKSGIRLVSVPGKKVRPRYFLNFVFRYFLAGIFIALGFYLKDKLNPYAIVLGIIWVNIVILIHPFIKKETRG
ncbi:MAG: ATP synthase subunit I [Spirochaetes bacterium]|nr:ATP synthase subunit I [Spirochaetota bacterium]